MHTTSTAFAPLVGPGARRRSLTDQTSAPWSASRRSIRTRLAAALECRTGPTDGPITPPRREQPFPFC